MAILYLKKPKLTGTFYEYDGTYHSPSMTDENGYYKILDEYESTNINVSGTTSAKDVGDYKVTFSLANTDVMRWEDNTTSSVSYAWHITGDSGGGSGGDSETKTVLSFPSLSPITFEYDGSTHSPSISNYNSNLVSRTGTLSAKEIGSYEIWFSLIDKTNYVWEDGTTNDYVLVWHIEESVSSKTSVPKPYLIKSTFEYDGDYHSPTVSSYDNGLIMCNVTPENEVGVYWITFSLRNKGDYEWEDGTTDDIEYSWRITGSEGKLVVDFPRLSPRRFTYDGNYHSPSILNCDSSIVSYSGDIKKKEQGSYIIAFSLIDTDNYEWRDGTTSEYWIRWWINPPEEPEKTTVNRPSASPLSFTFDGNSHEVAISSYDENIISCSGTSRATDAGSYKLTFSLIDKDSYVWDNDTSSDYVINWVIKKMSHDKPYLTDKEFIYDGETHSPAVKDFFSEYMSISGVETNVNAGTYNIIVSFISPSNHEWSDGSSSPCYLEWVIHRKDISKPYLEKDSFIYNETIITPKIINFNETAMEKNEDLSATNAGEYEIVITLDDNFKWEDGSIPSIKLPWKIKRAIAKIPYLDKDLVYNSFKQSPHWIDYDIRKIIIGGINEAINVGEYDTEFSLTDNYIWEDGTLDTIIKSWKILKLGIMTPKQSNALYYNEEIQYPEWFTTLNLKNIKYTGETSGKKAGKYNVECECDDNCYFIDTGTSHCSTDWTIRKRVCYQIKGDTYLYTGEPIEAEFSAYYLDALKISGQTVGINVGKYIAEFEIIDPDNNKWASSVILTPGRNGVLEVPWYIARDIEDLDGGKAKVPIPSQSNYLVYNGEKQSPVFAGYDEEKMALLGVFPSEIGSGTYYVTFRLKDGYIWVDDTTEDKEVPWDIFPYKVPFPYILSSVADDSVLYYYEINGKRYPIWVNYRPEIMTMTGDTYDIDFSWHTTYFELKDKKNYEWVHDNDIYDIYPVHWKLTEEYVPEEEPIPSNEKKIHIPKQVNPPIEDGDIKYPEWDYYDDKAINTLGGEWEGIAAGERFVILELVPGYIWEDDTDEIKTVPWEILPADIAEEEIPNEPISIPIPEQINIPYYSGYVIYPEWDTWADYGFDIVWGTLMEVPAGQYKIKLRLKTDYIWEDGTTEDKIVYWIILPRDLEEEEIPPSSPDDPNEPDEPREPEKEIEETIPTPQNNCCCCCCSESDENTEDTIADKKDIDDLFTEDGNLSDKEYNVGEDDIASKKDIDDLF